MPASYLRNFVAIFVFYFPHNWYLKTVFLVHSNQYLINLYFFRPKTWPESGVRLQFPVVNSHFPPAGRTGRLCTRYVDCLNLVIWSLWMIVIFFVKFHRTLWFQPNHQTLCNRHLITLTWSGCEKTFPNFWIIHDNHRR